MISKELLSEVLDIELELKRNELNPIPTGKESGSEVIFYWVKGETYFHNGSSINIYELAHKCKEWAYKQGYEIVESAHKLKMRETKKYSYVFTTFDGKKILFNPHRTFKACQWILDNQSKATDGALYVPNVPADEIFNPNDPSSF